MLVVVGNVTLYRLPSWVVIPKDLAGITHFFMLDFSPDSGIFALMCTYIFKFLK